MDKDIDFNKFQDFIAKFPLTETCFPVCVVPPDGEGDYWMIQLALPMKNKCIDCNVWEATTHEINDYRNKSLKLFKETVGLK